MTLWIFCYVTFLGVASQFTEKFRFMKFIVITRQLFFPNPAIPFCQSQFSVSSTFLLVIEKKKKFVNIFTARKRCLGQGNVFTPVCLFPEGRGDLHLGVCLQGGVCIQGGLLPRGLHPGKGRVCIQGGSGKN